MRRRSILNRVLLFSFIIFASSHEVCIDLSGAKPFSNPYCSDYNNFSCCTQQTDTSLQNLVNGLGIQDQTCLNFIKKTTCARCEPWGAHLFGVEAQNPSKFPHLCPQYCASFYSSCSNVEMNWPAGENPFRTTEKILKNAYPTQESFCNAFGPSDPNYCYSGSKFTPSPPPPPPISAPILCTQTFAVSGSGDGKAMKIVDPKDSTNRLFIAYQSGLIRVLNKATGAIMSDLIKLPASYDGEAGLHGIATHPNFKSNGKLYVYYSSKSRKAECQDNDWCNGNTCTNGFCTGNYLVNVLEEYFVPAGSNIAQTTALRTLFTLSKPFAIHNGGDLQFGPDGMLWMPTGDGGSFNDPYDNAQNLNRRVGKILRLDVDRQPLPGRNYGVPSDNPFLDRKFPEIWAYGLRNPWRCSFDRANPSYFFCGDVGEGNREEVNLIKKGGNYGWPKYEGNIVTPGVNYNKDIGPKIDPILWFDHSTADSASIGGVRYRGSKSPCHQGVYFFANWNSILYYATETGSGTGKFNFNQQTSKFQTRCATGTNCQAIRNVVGFSEDSEGEMYILGIGSVQKVVEPSRCGLTCSALPSSSQSSTRTSTSAQTLSTSMNPTRTSVDSSFVYYPLDSLSGGATDASGNGRTATVIGNPVVVPGKIGNGVKFDQSVIQALQVPGGNLLASTFSLSFWMNPTKTTNLMKICSSKGTWNEANGFQLELNPSTNFLNFVASGGSLATFGVANLAYSSWNHIAVVVNGVQCSLYLNGAFVKQVDIVSVKGATTPLYLASNNKGIVNGFVGILDEFRISTVALTASQVSQLYNGQGGSSSSIGSSGSANPTTTSGNTPTGTGGSLPAYLSYSFEATSGGTVVDTSGNGRTATLMGGPTIVPGKTGNGLKFVQTGAMQQIQVANGNTLANVLSVAFWMNPTDTDSLSKIASSKANWDEANGFQLELDSKTNSINFVASGSNTLKFSVPNLKYLQYNHVAVVVNGVQVSLYLNGSLVSSLAFGSASAAVKAATSPLFIGSNNKSAANGFTGILDEFKMFSSALTAAQVSQVFNS